MQTELRVGDIELHILTSFCLAGQSLPLLPYALQAVVVLKEV